MRVFGFPRRAPVRAIFASALLLWSSAGYSVTPLSMDLGSRAFDAISPGKRVPVFPSALESELPELDALREHNESPGDYFSRQLAAANQGDAAAQWRLADAYESGYGTPKNLSEASKWLRLTAATNGLVPTSAK